MQESLFDKIEAESIDEAESINEAEVSKSTINSDAVKKSWLNTETAAMRSKKDNVLANGEPFSSVAKAFECLGLPRTKHIKFRRKLKDEGKAAFLHEGKEYHFTLAPRKTKLDGHITETHSE